MSAKLYVGWLREVGPAGPVDPGYGIPGLGPVDPGFGVTPPIDPGYGRPIWGGRPDNSLPISPGHPGNKPPGRPVIPPHPSHRPPAAPAHPWIPGHWEPIDPGYGKPPIFGFFPVDPGWGISEKPPARPDQGLPGGGKPPHPDQGLPGTGAPPRPDNSLPGGGQWVPTDPDYGKPVRPCPPHGGIPHPPIWAWVPDLPDFGTKPDNTLPGSGSGGESGKATVTLYPAQATVLASGGSGSVNVTLTTPGTWEIAPTPDWVTVTPQGPQTADVQMIFTATQNTTGLPRQAIISVNDAKFTLNQGAV